MRNQLSPNKQRKKKQIPNNYQRGVFNDNSLLQNRGQFKNTNDLLQRQYEQSIHFGDWITLEKDNEFVLSHCKGTNSLGLEEIRKTKQLQKFNTFTFFEILPTSEPQKHLIITYQSSFYLMHVETGMFLSCVLDQGEEKNAIFNNIALKHNKSESCLFRFKREMKEKHNNNSQRGRNGFQFSLLEQDNNNFVKLNSHVRILNCLSEKYIEVVRTETNNSHSQLRENINRGLPFNARGLNNPKYMETQSAQEIQKLSYQNEDSFNIWLSCSFDYFMIRLQRRTKEYNPILLSNYDTVMIYNRFSNTYLGVRKKQGLIDIVNSSKLKKEEFYKEDYLQKNDKFIIESKQKSKEFKQKQEQSDLTSYGIFVNSNFLSAKNCLVEQMSVFSYENRNSFSYLWRVFTCPQQSISQKQLKQQPRNEQVYPCLIKSRDILYFQHIETGLFLMRNQNQAETGNTYLLCQDYKIDMDQRDNAKKFLFQVQNLSLLRYDRQFILNPQIINLTTPKTNLNNKLEENQLLISTSFPVTLGFDDQQFLISKINVYPRIAYFTYHFPQFLKILISFLNNPKAVDDRVYLLKQKLTLMEMVYENILCRGFKQISQIDKNFYFLKHTVQMLKIIRLKLKHYQLQATNIKNNKEISKQSKFKPTTSQNNDSYQQETHSGDNYIFQNTKNPLHQLLQLKSNIFQTLKPLIKKILKYLALVFSTQQRDIFDLIRQKETISEMKTNVQRKQTEENFENQTQTKKQTLINKKKKSTIMSSSMFKRQLRINHLSSFKSSSSSISQNSSLFNPDNASHKSTFKSGYNWKDKEECSSEILKELIKSLVDLLEVEPQACSEILKLLSIEQPYVIIGQLNDKLQNLESNLKELNETGSKGKYSGYEHGSNMLIGTSLKLHKHLESFIYQEMMYCIKLINHIIHCFNEDIDDDWSKNLTFIQNNFEIKVLYHQQSHQENQKQTHRKNGQLAINYNKRWYKLTEILKKTQNNNSKQYFKLLREKIKTEENYKKNLLKQNKNNRLPNKSGPSQNKQGASRSSFLNESDHLPQSSSLSIPSIASDNFLLKGINYFSSSKIKSKPRIELYPVQKKQQQQKMGLRREIIYVQDEKNYFFQCLKEIIKLKLISLKSKGLPVIQMLSIFNYQRHGNKRQTNPFTIYKQLKSLSFVLQIANSIQVSLLNGSSSSFKSLRNINISLLSNSRYIICDNKPISEQTNLFKVLNYGSISSFNDDEINDQICPLFLREENIEYLIQESPYFSQFLSEIFNLFVQRLKETKLTRNAQREIFIDSIQGLKILVISLQVFVSIGRWNFKMLKKVQNYLLNICQLIAFYEKSKQFWCNQPEEQNETNNQYENSEEYDQQSSGNKNIPKPMESGENQLYNKDSAEIIYGLKDALGSLVFQLNHLIEIVYIQKKRVTHYPHIQNHVHFFESSHFQSRYLRLIQSCPFLVEEMPILTEMYQLNYSLASAISLNYVTKTNKIRNQQKVFDEYRFPYRKKNSLTLNETQQTQSFSALKQNQVIMKWPYLSSQQIIIFYPKEIQNYYQTFIKTTSTILELNELSLMLNTLESLQEWQKVKSNLIIEIRQKISTISENLHDLVKIEGNKKVIKGFGLIELILSIIMNNKILQKSSIKPMLQFLIDIRMWEVTVRQFQRVLNKGGLSNTFSTIDSDVTSRDRSKNFLLNNINKEEFLVISAKYLQERSSQYERGVIGETLCFNLVQVLDYLQGQPYQVLMQKLSFLCMIVEITNNEDINRIVFNKLMNRQDVQLYLEGFKTYKNFEFFCYNLNKINLLLENKKIVNEKINLQHSTSQNLNSNPLKSSQIYGFGSSVGSNFKMNKVSKDFAGQGNEMSSQKKEEISKLVLMMALIFKICKKDNKLKNEYFKLFLSQKEFLKILKTNISVLGNCYELLKPILICLESNQLVFQPTSTTITSPHQFIQSSAYLSQSFPRQDMLFSYLQAMNEVLSQFHLYSHELDTYQATSTFFLPFIEKEEGVTAQQPHLQFNKEKIKKINSKTKNITKTHFWELLLYVPSYQKEEGLLVSIQKIIINNLQLFIWKNNTKIRQSHQLYPQDSLNKLEIPLNRIMHTIYDNLLNLQQFLKNYKGSRFLRLQTRVKKLTKIFIEIFPTIQVSLSNLKSLKLKQIQQKQDQADNHILEEQDDQSLGFFSSEDINLNSQNSYFDRQESFQTIGSKFRNIQQSKRMVMQEPKTLQVKRKTLNKDKQKDDKFNAQIIGYQFVTKLSNNGKLERFMKIFQQLENRRQSQLQKKQFQRQNSIREQLESMNFIEKRQLLGNIDEYLGEESEDYVIDYDNSRIDIAGKLKRQNKIRIKKYMNPMQKFKLKQKKSSQELNEIEPYGDSSDYSHHAIIVAENSLNEDTLNQNFKSSNFKQSKYLLNLNPNRSSNILQEANLQSFPTIQNFKRSDYSQFYENLKSYNFYQVITILKQVLFTKSCSKSQSKSHSKLTPAKFQYENQLYYELQKLLLDFFSLNATFNSLFQYIQNYLKLQIQKIEENDLDYKYICESQGQDRPDQGLFLHERISMNLLSKNHFALREIDDGLFYKRTTQLNPDILFTLYRRQKFSIIQELLDNYVQSLTSVEFQEEKQPYISNQSIFDSQKENRKSMSSLKTFSFLNFLSFCLEKEDQMPLETCTQCIYSHHQYNSEQYLSKKIVSSEKSQKEFRSSKNTMKTQSKFNQKLNQFSQISYQTSPQKSTIKNCQSQINNFICVKKNSQNRWIKIVQFLKRRKQKIEIVRRLMKILNIGLRDLEILEYKGQNIEFSEAQLLLDIQENLKQHIYELIQTLDSITVSMKRATSQTDKKDSSSEMSSFQDSATFDDIAMVKYEIKILLMKFLPDLVTFLRLGNIDRQNKNHNCAHLNSSVNCSNIISQIVEFSLRNSYELLVIDPQESQKEGFSSYYQSMTHNDAPIYSLNSKLSIESVELLKQYFSSIALLIQNPTTINSDFNTDNNLQITHQLIHGTIDYSFKTDLISPNLHSLQVISLLTSCLTFIQLFLSSISSANILKNHITNELKYVFFSLSDENKQIQKGEIPTELFQKLIEFQLHLYGILFQNKDERFSSSQSTSYLKYMMKFSQTPSKKDENFQQESKDKPERYIALLHLLIESLNIFHHAFYKISFFPHFQSNLFQQRKIFIQRSKRLNLDMERLKEIYGHLNEVFRFVIISPREQNGGNKLQIAVFPYFREFEFVWKFNLIKLLQSLNDQSQRKNIIYCASRVLLQQSSQSRRIKFYLVKWSSYICGLSQLTIISILFLHLFGGGLTWTMVIFNILLVFNLILLILILASRLTRTIIMQSIIELNHKTSSLKAYVILAIMYLPIIVAIGANLYSYWETNAVPFILFVFLFNRIEALFQFIQEQLRQIKSILIFLFTCIVTVFSFHFFGQLNVDSSLQNDSYLPIQEPIFTIEGHSFNFLNMVFELTQDKYITDPITVVFYVWLFLIQILVIAKVTFFIMERVNSKSINSDIKKTHECYICSKNAQMLLDQHVNKAQKIQSSKPSQPTHRKLRPYFLNNDLELKRLLQSNSESIDQDQREQQMGKIIESHIKQRHNIFHYISYSCYLLDKKQTLLTQKEKMIKKRLESRDYDVYL